jgi:hypothetical protein
MRAAFTATNLVSAAISAAMPGTVSANQTTTVAISARPLNNDAPFTPSAFQIAAQQSLTIPVENEWTGESESRFDALATKEAIGTIEPEEFAELEYLSQLRRQSKHPRTTDEILWEIRQRRHTLALVEVLTKYVEFHNPARS